MKRYIIAVSLLFTALFIQLAPAQEFSVQGVLRDPSGRTLADGTNELTFKLYDAETGRNELWSETQGSVELSNGMFSAILGKSSSLASLGFDQTYWLGISVDGQPEISTIMKITTNPYSLAVKGMDNSFPSTGKQVRTLVAEYQFAGTYSVTWQGENDQGLMLPSGIYFYRMNAGEFQQMHKLVLLK
jgi:WD40 repeat protein